MPKGPQGQRRPAEAIGCAVIVRGIATGDHVDMVKRGKVRSGKAKAALRSATLSPEQRSEISRKAAEGRWR
jgi:hypothetical protein